MTDYRSPSDPADIRRAPPLASGDYRATSEHADVRRASTVTPVVAPEPSWLKWAPWVIGALILALLVSTLGRSHPQSNVTTYQTTTSSRTGTSSLGASLQSYLATDAEAGRRFIFDDLHFATGSAALPPEAAGALSEIARVLGAYPAAQVRIDGYADARPSEPGNAELGAARARAVGAALVAFGVAPERITTATGGDSNPIAPNTTPSGQAENRRTELVVTAK